MKKIILILLPCFLFKGCIQPYDVKIQEFDRENGGKRYTMTLPSGQAIQIGLTPGDSLDYFSSVLSGDKEYETLNFYNNGRVESKVTQNLKTKSTNGRKYYFSEQTGNLESYYTYRNDTLEGRGVEFYDQTANEKTIYKFIDGKYCGKQELDEFQRMTDATGCLLFPDLKKVGKYWELDKKKWIEGN